MTSAQEAERVIKDIRRDFFSMDRDQDGYLKFEEIPLTVLNKIKARETFNEIDSNKDGKISFDEYIEFLLFQFGQNLDQEVFDRFLWISLDRNGRGYISFDEYKRFHERRFKYRKKHLKKKNVATPLSDHDLKTEFNKIDIRNKGKISFKEKPKGSIASHIIR